MKETAQVRTLRPLTDKFTVPHHEPSDLSELIASKIRFSLAAAAGTFAFAFGLWILIATNGSLGYTEGILQTASIPRWGSGGYLMGAGAIGVSLFLTVTVDAQARNEVFDDARAAQRIALENLTALALFGVSALAWFILLDNISWATILGETTSETPATRIGVFALATPDLLVTAATGFLFAGLAANADLSSTAIRYSLSENAKAVKNLDAAQEALTELPNTTKALTPKKCWWTIAAVGGALGAAIGGAGAPAPHSSVTIALWHPTVASSASRSGRARPGVLAEVGDLPVVDPRHSPVDTDRLGFGVATYRVRCCSQRVLVFHILFPTRPR